MSATPSVLFVPVNGFQSLRQAVEAAGGSMVSTTTLGDGFVTWLSVPFGAEYRVYPDGRLEQIWPRPPLPGVRP